MMSDSNSQQPSIVLDPRSYAVFHDGTAYCAVGPGFINLQESAGQAGGGGPFAGFAEEVFARGLKDGTTKVITPSPAPDTTALREAVKYLLHSYTRRLGNGDIALKKEAVDQLEALLRSEPRGEEPRDVANIAIEITQVSSRAHIVESIVTKDVL